jgi:hypothetical protein
MRAPSTTSPSGALSAASDISPPNFLARLGAMTFPDTRPSSHLSMIFSENRHPLLGIMLAAAFSNPASCSTT